MQRRSIITVMLIPLIGVVLLPVLVDIATDQLPEAWEGHLWLAWPLAAVLAGTVIVIEVRRARPSPASAVDRDRLHRAADDLASAVANQWRAEATMRPLHQPAPILLGWQQATGDLSASRTAIVTDRTGRSAGQIPTSGILNHAAETLLELPNRQLVALGPPGAGKTALAVLLTSDLLVRRDYNDPVPVLFTPSGWDPRSEHLDAWLARRLVEEYPALADVDQYGAGSGAALVAAGLVLPVLDGLDEMPQAWLVAALPALNDAVCGGRPLVVTCRTEEYRAAVRTSGAVLAHALVLEIGPVRPDAAVTYLATAGPADDPRWEPVFSHLLDHPTSALAAALSTPLMLWLARVVYQPPLTDPAELLDRGRFSDRHLIEDHLLDAFLPTMYAPRPAAPARPPTRGYPPERARDWLTFLAGHLHRHGTRELAWWELHRALPRLVLAGFAALGVLSAGVLFVVLATTVPAMQAHTQAATAIVTAAATVPVAGIAVGLAGPPTAPARLMTRPPGAGRRQLRSLAALALVAVPYFVIVLARTSGVALAVGSCLVGLLGCAIIGMVGRPEPISATSPAGLYRSDRRTLVVVLAAFVTAGAVNGLLTAALVARTPYWIVSSLDCAIVLGLAGFVVARSRSRPPGHTGAGLTAAAAGVVVGAVAGAAIGRMVGGFVGGGTAKLVGSVLGGLGLGLVAGLALTATGWFVFTQACLAARGQLPWHLMTFLQDAQRRGVLRQIGGVYQFRHARLQDWLVSRTGRSAPPQTAVPGRELTPPRGTG